MAIRAIIEKLDDVAEPLREHFKPGTADTGTEGKFVLDATPVNGWALEDVGGLKTALSTERSTRQTLEATVLKYKDIDPEKARTALTELEELKRLDPTKEADKIANTKFETAKAQLLDAHKAEIGQREERITGLTSTVDYLVRDQRATAAIAAAKGSVELLLPHVLNSTRTVEKDGKFIVEVIRDGVVQIDGKGNPISIDDFVGQMRSSETFARAFDGEGQSGGGKQPDKEGHGKTGKGDFGGSREERSAAIAKKFNLPAA